MLDRYEHQRTPLQVDFRALVHWIRYGERLTHFIHPYPAKLLPHIAHFFVANPLLSTPGAKVLDPFCGSGTVLLEAAVAGRHPVGADSNPLARLVAQTKVRTVPAQLLRTGAHRLRRLLAHAAPPRHVPDVVNISLWFPRRTIRLLAQLREAIDSLDDARVRDFFSVCFSWCVNKVSLADPRVAVPVRLRPNQYPKDHWLHARSNKLLRGLKHADVYAAFFDIVDANIARMASLAEVMPEPPTSLTIFDDACESARNRQDTVDLVVTSPPYAGAQKYIRSCSLSLGWLGLCNAKELRQYERKSIGREHYSKGEYATFRSSHISRADKLLRKIYEVNPLRAHIASEYLREMSRALRGAATQLKPGGFFVLVAGSNTICGQRFDTPAYLIPPYSRPVGANMRGCAHGYDHSRCLLTSAYFRNRSAEQRRSVTV